MKRTVLIALLALVLCGCSGQDYMGKIPYGVRFGSSYEEILLCDPGAGTPELNRNGNSLISPHRDIDGTFLGYSADELSITLMYVLGMNDSLNHVGEYITINEGSSITAEDLTNRMYELFSEQYGNPTSNTYALYTWDSDNIEITLVMWDKTRVSITYELK